MKPVLICSADKERKHCLTYSVDVLSLNITFHCPEALTIVPVVFG